jgi:hypothetical protein
MNKKDLEKLGSKTAKRGFKNEDDVVDKFNNWENDEDAQKWLEKMGYPVDEIEKVEAVKLHGYKTDVQVQITIYMKEAIAAENLSVKLISNPRGYNQVDKRWVDRYTELWDIPDDVIRILKLFTGEISPKNTERLKDERRVFLTEMAEEDQNKLLNFFKRINF